MRNLCVKSTVVRVCENVNLQKPNAVILKCAPYLKGSPTKSLRGGGTALNVCETSPPDAVSSSSLCRADPSRAELRAAEGCGVGRRCRWGHNSKGSWQSSCRRLRNGTDAWRSRWGCGRSGRCCQTEGWTGSSSSPCDNDKLGSLNPARPFTGTQVIKVAFLNHCYSSPELFSFLLPFMKNHFGLWVLKRLE